MSPLASSAALTSSTKATTYLRKSRPSRVRLPGIVSSRGVSPVARLDERYYAPPWKTSQVSGRQCIMVRSRARRRCRRLDPNPVKHLTEDLSGSGLRSGAVSIALEPPGPRAAGDQPRPYVTCAGAACVSHPGRAPGDQLRPYDAAAIGWLNGGESVVVKTRRPRHLSARCRGRRVCRRRAL